MTLLHPGRAGNKAARWAWSVAHAREPDAVPATGARVRLETSDRMFARSFRFARTVAGLVFRRPLVSVSMIGLDPEGRIALAQRRDNGRWSLPGGLVDWGETIEACAARELAEEVGLTLGTVERVVGVYADPGRDPLVHSIAIALAVRVSGAIRVADPDEILAARMVTWPELVEEIGLASLSHDHGRHLEDFRAGRTTVLA